MPNSLERAGRCFGSRGFEDCKASLRRGKKVEERHCQTVINQTSQLLPRTIKRCCKLRKKGIRAAENQLENEGSPQQLLRPTLSLSSTTPPLQLLQHVLATNRLSESKFRQGYS